jgi:hypothetical protein
MAAGAVSGSRTIAVSSGVVSLPPATSAELAGTGTSAADPNAGRFAGGFAGDRFVLGVRVFPGSSGAAAGERSSGVLRDSLEAFSSRSSVENSALAATTAAAIQANVLANDRRGRVDGCSTGTG